MTQWVTNTTPGYDGVRDIYETGNKNEKRKKRKKAKKRELDGVEKDLCYLRWGNDDCPR